MSGPSKTNEMSGAKGVPLAQPVKRPSATITGTPQLTARVETRSERKGGKQESASLADSAKDRSFGATPSSANIGRAVRYASETSVATSPNAATDPAILIGLAIATGKTGGIAAVPHPVLVPLVRAANSGCSACEIVVRWLERRTSSSNMGGGDE